MDKESFIIIYTTLFLVLSIALYFVKVPGSENNNDYRKSRISLGSGLFLIAALGISHIISPEIHFNDYSNFGFMLALCYIFTYLNYLSFLYMIESSHKKRIQIMKIAVYVAPIMSALFIAGDMYPAYTKAIKISLSCISVLIHFFLLTGCFREYDKFILQRSNYFDNYPNISWIPTMLWTTFILACMTVGCFFFKPLIPLTGILSLIVYTYIPLKLLSIHPETIQIVRESVENKDIVAEAQPADIFAPTETDSATTQTPAATPTPDVPAVTPATAIPAVPAVPEMSAAQASAVISESTTEHPAASGEQTADLGEQTAISGDEKNSKRYEKVAALIEKWVQEERYTQPEINIKDAATQMGTNSYYLSTYINRVLETSFAVWLNSLRIEKSKEYLTSNGGITMEECGIKVGYVNLYNYSRWFKAITGVSPLKWKKNNS